MRKAFTFYGSYYESIKELPIENQNELYRGIIEYSFEKKEQNFTGISLSIWHLIKPNIDNNISKYENGLSLKIKGKTNIKKRSKSEIKAKDEQSESTPLSLSLNISNNYYSNNKELNSIFIDFLKLRKKLKAENSDSTIKLLIKKLEKYDDDTKIKMIEQSIENSWKGLFELKKQYTKTEMNRPNWLDKKIQSDKPSETEQKEMEDLLKNYK